jgi:hypothetical protein
VAGALLAMALLAGCSQEQALAPVAGDDITQLRIAVNDALAEAAVPVLVSPVCREEDGVTRCTGTTRSGGAIEAETGPEDGTIVVKADGRTIYDGPIAEIVQRAAEVVP